jgi:hypothetical protein
MMTLVELTVVLVLCPAALAGWADTRYPNLRPKELRRTVIHLGITAVLACLVLRPALILVAMIMAGPVGRMIEVGIACSTITYGLIVTLWVMRSVNDLARLGR